MELKLSDTKSYNSEISYLAKSPCKDCGTREDLPHCIQGCEILDQIQTLLAHSISNGKSISEYETYDVPADVLEQI